MNRISAERAESSVPTLAEVRVQERLVVVLVELMVDREVREVEEEVAHAGVLPVDDPDALAVEDEVRVQEVVVAGTTLRCRRGLARSASACSLRPGVVVGDRDAVLAAVSRYVSTTRKESKRPGIGGPFVHPAERLGGLADPRRRPHLLRRNRHGRR